MVSPKAIDDDHKIKSHSISDFLRLPCLGYQRGIVVNEAMLCRLPAAAGKVIGASMIGVSGVNVLMIDLADPDQLCEVLKAVLSGS